MTTDAVTSDLQGHVATVEVHRPPHNWFDLEVLGALTDAVLELDDVPECRAIVVCAEGKNFCAGANLQGDLLNRSGDLYDIAVRLFTSRKPMVAAVQGAAVGGGFGLALATDFRVVSPETRMTCNFAKLGFHHGFGITVTLPAIVGQQRALELMYTGADVRGEQAVAIGLADRLAPADGLRDAAHAFANEIAASGPLSLLSIRQTMRGDLAAKVRAATDHELAVQSKLRATEDYQEGVAAMADRRPPEFQGR